MAVKPFFEQEILNNIWKTIHPADISKSKKNYEEDEVYEKYKEYVKKNPSSGFYNNVKNTNDLLKNLFNYTNDKITKKIEFMIDFPEKIIVPQSIALNSVRKIKNDLPELIQKEIPFYDGHGNRMVLINMKPEDIKITTTRSYEVNCRCESVIVGLEKSVDIFIQKLKHKWDTIESSGKTLGVYQLMWNGNLNVDKKNGKIIDVKINSISMDFDSKKYSLVKI